MSPAPQPPGRPPQGKPGDRKPGPAPQGKPTGPAGKPGPGRPAPGKPTPPPPPPKDPNLERSGKYFEVRKGRAKGDDDEEEAGADSFEVALPRSISKEQEEEDLKRRFDRDHLPDIDERHHAVKVVEVPQTMARRAGGKWLLLVLAVLLIAGVGTTFKTQILDFLKKAGIVSDK